MQRCSLLCNQHQHLHLAAGASHAREGDARGSQLDGTPSKLAHPSSPLSRSLALSLSLWLVHHSDPSQIPASGLPPVRLAPCPGAPGCASKIDAPTRSLPWSLAASKIDAALLPHPAAFSGGGPGCYGWRGTADRGGDPWQGGTRCCEHGAR